MLSYPHILIVVIFLHIHLVYIVVKLKVLICQFDELEIVGLWESIKLNLGELSKNQPCEHVCSQIWQQSGIY